MDQLKREIARELLAGVRQASKLLIVDKSETHPTDSPLAIVVKVWPIATDKTSQAPRYFEVRVREMM